MRNCPKCGHEGGWGFCPVCHTKPVEKEVAQTSKCAYRIELKVKSDMTLTELKEIVERFVKVGAQATVAFDQGKLIVVLSPPESLKAAPAGTHEFAAGWIIRG